MGKINTIATVLIAFGTITLAVGAILTYFSEILKLPNEKILIMTLVYILASILIIVILGRKLK